MPLRRTTQHSGAQLSILRMYREFLRLANKKTDTPSRLALLSDIRKEFRTNAATSRRDFVRIDWMMNRGRTKLEELKKTKHSDKYGVMIFTS